LWVFSDNSLFYKPVVVAHYRLPCTVKLLCGVYTGGYFSCLFVVLYDVGVYGFLFVGHTVNLIYKLFNCSLCCVKVFELLSPYILKCPPNTLPKKVPLDNVVTVLIGVHCDSACIIFAYKCVGKFHG